MIPVALADMTEKQWTAQIVELATTLGYRRYHTWRSKHSAAGWPDEALVRDRLILAELKREGGKPSADQVVWLDALAKAGQEVYLWVPSDLDEVARVLGKPWHYGGQPTPELTTDFIDRAGSFPSTWTPNSLWIPGRGRYDSIEKAAA